MIHIGFSRMKRPQWWPLTRTSWIRFSPLLIYVSMVKVECFSSFILHSKVPSSFLLPFYSSSWNLLKTIFQNKYCLHSPIWHGVVWNRGIPAQIKWKGTKDSERMNCRLSEILWSCILAGTLWVCALTASYKLSPYTIETVHSAP